MRKSQLKTVKIGDTITHSRYGDCSIIEIAFAGNAFFGMVVKPLTSFGLDLLAKDCGVADIPVIEGSLRKLEAR